MSISEQLLREVKDGRVVLFLGSGALYGATLPDRKIPLGNDLRDLLCKEFLNQNYYQESLAHVAAMAISQTSLYTVQDFIKNYFNDLKPADFHEKLPLFKWRALFTTNYDFLIETTYSNVVNKVQNLNIVLSNADNIDETRVTNDKVPYIKLHGCISRTHDQSLPLILTTDQYNECLSNRKRLFNHLYELAYDNTIVFVGHSLQDFNIRSILLELEKESPNGRRHYLLKPGLDQIEKDYWGQKKISAIDLTFERFIQEIDDNVSNDERLLSLVRPQVSHPIQRYYNNKHTPSYELIDFLTNSVELVSQDISIKSLDPKEFFKGVDQEWFPISTNIAIDRNIHRDIFETALERAESDRSNLTDFYILKGEAGSGKSVLLRQLAWEAKDSSLGIILWVKEGCSADIDFVEEIISESNERVYIFWDNAAVNAIEINRFILKALRKNVRVTVLTAERYNEWNVRCDELDELVTEKYTLKYLSETEIEKLVVQLEKYDCLGPNLVNKSHEQRCKELKEIHGRQLLVALHEATMGEPFEDIIFNEYNNIFPESAKSLYLTVCTLNRLRVPVRAGLISRIHEISFDDFQRDLYKPLEKVVITRGMADQDIHFSARHSEIAEIVFNRGLSNVEDRYREYINVISKLNISFSSDKSSFRTMIRAKALNELFPKFEDVNAIYKHALEVFGDDPYLMQQMANYERIRANGNYDYAIELLQKAQEIAPYDSSILHSLSVIWRDKAAKTEDPHLRRKCRAESRSYLEQINVKWGISSYVSASLIELSIEALKDLLDDEFSTETSIKDAIRKVQLNISENKQKYPSDGHVFSLEATFASLINDHSRALLALEKSFEENDREPYLAIRLANSYLEKADENSIEKARRTIQLALERRRADHKLNFHYAELLRNNKLASSDDLQYYYRRAFTPHDRNYHAQFWFARFAFSNVDLKIHRQSTEVFDSLRKARLSHGDRNKLRDKDSFGGKTKQYTGVIQRKKHSFGFVKIDGPGIEIFLSAKSCDEETWALIVEGDRITFHLGFTFSGPIATDVTI